MAVTEMLTIRNDADIVLARQQIRDFAREGGFSSVDQALIATAVSEIARNILVFAGQGTVEYDWQQEGQREGIQIVAEDHGPGIPDVNLALRDGYSTRGSLGMGLPGVKRLMDDFKIESSAAMGTRVTIRKWKS